MINLELPNLTTLKPRIVVVGVGGAGGNAINNMIAAGIEGVDFVAANTDAQALAMSSAEQRLQLGVNLTEGLGAGSKPEIGEAAAEEAADEIRSTLEGANMVFIAAGMGGGTGTGAASVLARISRELDILTVGVVTKPFHFEGNRRMRVAEAGIEELRKNVDTLIVIPNQNLFRIADAKTTFAEAFVLADRVLHAGIACITDLIVRNGLINLDFADIETIMKDMGTAMMGTGEAEGEDRARKAAEMAIANPLLDDISLRGAKGLLVSITGSPSLTLVEFDAAANRVREEVDPDANIIVGTAFDPAMEDKVRVSIVASGLRAAGDARANAPASPGKASAPAPEGAGTAPNGASAARGTGAAAGQGATQPAPAPARPAGGGASPAPAGPPPANPGRAPASTSGRARSGGELKRRLSEAIAQGGKAEGTAGERPPEPSRPASGAEMMGHQAQGGVRITEGPPRHLAAEPPVTASRPPASAPSARDEEPSFTPAPPARTRKGAPRMPSVEDFPSVGQREYRAKAAKGEAGADAAPKKAEKKRKTGFFGRLTGAGRMRRESDSPDAAGAPGGDGARGAGAARRPGARESAKPAPRDADRGAGAGRAPARQEVRTPVADDLPFDLTEEQRIEMPSVLRKGAKP